MRHLILVAVCASLAAAGCSRGNGSTSTMAMQPVVSVVGCVAESSGAFLLTANAPASRNGSVGLEVDVTGKVEQKGEEEAATIPALRVSQLTGRGACANR